MRPVKVWPNVVLAQFGLAKCGQIKFASDADDMEHPSLGEVTYGLEEICTSRYSCGDGDVGRSGFVRSVLSARKIIEVPPCILERCVQIMLEDSVGGSRMRPG